MKKHLLSTLLAGAAVWAVTPAAHAAQAVAIDGDDIGGVVTSSKGPEAGVWVIAETGELPTSFIKIVVTDDQGRYVLPDLPPAKYKVWVRGYGLTDSKQVDAQPGKNVNLTAVVAPTAQAAAEIYPANYWYSMLKAPDASQFPGTGPNGNGISPGMVQQQDWHAHLKEQCLFCHQIGNFPTRTLAPSANSSEAWAERIAHGTGPVADPRMNKLAESYRGMMVNNMTRFGRTVGLKMFADWTDGISKGAVPEAPPRPSGVERNIVLTQWGWAMGKDGVSISVHDEITTDKRNPTVNANGEVYGVGTHYGNLTFLDPKTAKAYEVNIPGPDGKHDIEYVPHNPMLDQKGRLWFSSISRQGAGPTYCSDPKNPFAKLYPNGQPTGRVMGYYDPATKKIEMIPTCFGQHHLNFGYDKDNSLYFSGDTNVIGWFKTGVYDATKDAEKAQGWCPLVLDTNGDGKIDPNKDNWNKSEKELDPKKDTKLTGFMYGLNVNSADDSVWSAKFSPAVPSGVIRMERGANPPETCKVEYYEPPKKPDGSYAAFNGRGVDMDSKGIAWVAFGSGQVGRFDRGKCKVKTGPTAIGQQCPEGWSFIDSPGPKMAGLKDGSADWHYLTWVDLHDTLGLGKDVPIVPGTNSDSLLAIDPATNKWTVLRVPYPLGFYTRGLDGRIDDPKAGWKGRGLWADYSPAQNAHLHTEGGHTNMVKFQLRPDPLAH
ncbi:MAG: carboxypeptidase-like regulatory domain-containing protein [Rhodospirillaceae bacterium]|nr:carboxypeptidase-like regulatory domain-containing protein [Rhodospirillaceae bacterium]